jgi:hypothetical protein
MQHFLRECNAVCLTYSSHTVQETLLTVALLPTTIQSLFIIAQCGSIYVGQQIELTFIFYNTYNNYYSTGPSGRTAYGLRPQEHWECGSESLSRYGCTRAVYKFRGLGHGVRSGIHRLDG